MTVSPHVAGLERLGMSVDTAGQQLTNYMNAVNALNRVAVAFSKATMPVLVEPPPNYGGFVEELARAKVGALSWIDAVIADFNQVPNAFLAANSLVLEELEAITTGLDTLKSKPGDADASAAVAAAAKRLAVTTKPATTLVQDLQHQIRHYVDGVDADAATLSKASQQLEASLTIEEAAVAQLQASLAVLHSVINDRNEIVTLDKFANGAFDIVLAVAGAAVGAPFSGTAALIVGALVGAATSAYTAFDPLQSPPQYEESMTKLQSEVDAVTKEIGLENSIAALVRVTVSQFKDLAGLCADVNQSAHVITTYWAGIQTDLDAVGKDIDAILASLTKPSEVSHALQAVHDAHTSWTACETVMRSLSKATFTVASAVELAPGAIDPYCAEQAR